MKKLLILPFIVLFLLGCSSNDDGTTTPIVAGPLTEKTLQDVTYGNDPQQIMDVYLPANRTENTKVFVLIHGGFWYAGDKEDMNSAVPLIKHYFPNHAIVNINYRLAALGSPAYPKQIEDIQKALQYLEDSDYVISNDYALIGASAGAHLSMLYGYKHNTNSNVKAVCSIVGPADLLDPAYAEHPQIQTASLALTGTTTPTQDQIIAVNPVSHITAQSPATISFYGGQDELVPASQGPLLKARLDTFGVYNEFNFYPESGHDAAAMTDMYDKLVPFFQQHF